MQVDAEPVTTLEGRISWRSFISQQVPQLAVVTFMPFLSLWFLYAGPRRFFIIYGFILLVGTSSLLYVGIWLASVVIRFQVAGDQLTYFRLGRRARHASLADVVTVELDSRTQAGAAVWMCDGTTLYIPYDSVSNSNDLIEILRNQKENTGIVEGCLNHRGLARAIVYQGVVTCLLLAISVMGWLCLAMFLKPRQLGENPAVFGLLGFVLLGLCTAAFYFTVIHYWRGCVHSFHWDGETLRYRTVLSRTLHARSADEIDEASSRRPSSSQGEVGSWRSIRFRDGTRLKLHVGMLQKAQALFSALKTVAERRKSEVTAAMLSPISPESPLRELIQPHLSDGERVLWIGRPAYRKLWSEMSAEVLFGLIPGSMGALLLIVAWQIDRQDGGADFMAAIGLFFSGIGLYLIAAPWRYSRMLRNTLYAVTTQRAVIVNGVMWGSQSTVGPSGVEVETFDRDQVAMFEMIGCRRDIKLGGEWKRGRKGRKFWVNTGFLAADDQPAAEIAIRCLLSDVPDSFVHGRL